MITHIIIGIAMCAFLLEFILEGKRFLKYLEVFQQYALLRGKTMLHLLALKMVSRHFLFYRLCLCVQSTAYQWDVVSYGNTCSALCIDRPASVYASHVVWSFAQNQTSLDIESSVL